MTGQPKIQSQTKRIVFIPLTIEDEKTSEDFKRLCRQDGLHVHDLMLEAIQLVFKKHNFPPGNPQLTLQNYTEKKVSLGKCGYANCNFKAVGSGVYLSTNREYKLCMKHFSQAKNDRANWEFKESLGRDGDYSR